MSNDYSQGMGSGASSGPVGERVVGTCVVGTWGGWSVESGDM